MALKDFFNRLSRTKSNQDTKITAGGQITAPSSTLITVQPQRFGLDLAQYKQAVRSAENMDYTRRAKLYDMYENALNDTHVISVIEKRKDAITCLPIEFWRNGVIDDTITENISSPWFHDLLSDILDAQFWGFSLIQFNVGKDGYVEYFNVPRKHVDPQLKLIKRHQTDINGVPFGEYNGLLEVKGRHKLGLLASILPWVIYKNGTIGDWAQFAELFGMPIRDYSYDASDENARQRTLYDAVTQGSGSVYLHPDGTKLSFIEAGNKSGSAEVYDRFIKTCNGEISKAVLGNTLTTEASDTGTQALGTVHKKEEEGKNNADRQFILDVLNYYMTDIFAMLGINTNGGKFKFAEVQATPQEKAQLFNLARNQLNLPIDDDYIYQELGIEKPKNYDKLKAEEKQRQEQLAVALSKQSSEDETKRKEALENKAHFFDQAQDYRALNW